MKLLALLAVALLIAALFAAPAPLSAQDDKSDAKDDTVTDAPAAAAVKDKAVDAIDKFIAEAKASKKIDQEYPHWGTHLPKPPKVEFDDKHDYFWVLDTNKGTIRIKLMPDIAPMHVSSTMYLSRLRYYDGLKFHRVIPGFMAQGGCPYGIGMGGPGYQYDSEIDNDVKHDKPYLLSMANTGRPTTDGSQFFLTFDKTPWLDGKHTIFGEVVEGKDVVDKLENAGVPGDRSGRPKEELLMKKTSIEVKPKSE